jgi:UDP-2,3-diacylglucosamine pyrophosphatase LpxH
MKKKIKLVVSDLHLGRGRTLEGGVINALEEFHFAEKFAEFLHYYSSGQHLDAEVEIILNGDILNFLQVDYRGHYLTVITEPICLEIIEGIVKGHPAFFKALRDFAKKEGRSVSYVVGNHDQAMMWPRCREYLDQVLETSVKYKNIVYFFDGVHIEHGHMHEAANRIDPKKFFLKKDLPEPILNLPFGSHFFVDFVLKIKHQYPYVDKIRPFRRMMRWAIFNETTFTMSGFVKLCWYFLKSMFINDPRRHWPFRRILQVVLESAIFPDLSESARRILVDDRIHTVIFGHSHVYQYRQWAEDMEYFNTGTWTELTSLDIPSLGKITKLTYAMIEYPEDGARPRCRLKEWRGYHRIEEDVAVS